MRHMIGVLGLALIVTAWSVSDKVAYAWTPQTDLSVWGGSSEALPCSLLRYKAGWSYPECGNIDWGKVDTPAAGGRITHYTDSQTEFLPEHWLFGEEWFASDGDTIFPASDTTGLKFDVDTPPPLLTIGVNPPAYDIQIMPLSDNSLGITADSYVGFDGASYSNFINGMIALRNLSPARADSIMSAHGITLVIDGVIHGFEKVRDKW